MDANRLDITFAWSDADLLEVRVSIRFQDWSGTELAYVSRDELRGFAAALDVVAAGDGTATLTAGQRDLSFAELCLREYSRARRLALDVHLGRAPGTIIGGVGEASELRVTVPVERGQLPTFAGELRRLVTIEAGDATLPLPPVWP